VAAKADLMTSDSRVGSAVGLTWLPTASHQAVYDVLRALTDAGLVRRIQASGSVGGGTLERYNGADLTI
jgi:Fur family ferric uptake transcriptional regulator